MDERIRIIRSIIVVAKLVKSFGARSFRKSWRLPLRENRTVYENLNEVLLSRSSFYARVFDRHRSDPPSILAPISIGRIGGTGSGLRLPSWSVSFRAAIRFRDRRRNRDDNNQKWQHTTCHCDDNHRQEGSARRGRS